MLKVEEIRSVLAARTPPIVTEDKRRAAVAMILLGAEEASELFFIRRAEYPGDPWSGDVAFPGGGVEEQDESTRATAERETFEEIGLTLPPESYLGPLGEISGAYLPVSIACHLYHLDKLPELRLNGEVVRTFTVPFAVLLDPTRNMPATFHYRGQDRTHPTIDLSGYSEKMLWGISYRLLQKFCARLELGSLR